MKEKIKYPFYYYFSIIFFVIVSVFFWWVVFNNFSNGKYFSQQEIDYRQDKAVHVLQPINQDDLIIDSIANRRIVSNLVNIALKNKSKDIYQFADELKKVYKDSTYQIVYIDSVINRLQVKLPDLDREIFKDEVKKNMKNDSLLVWDEMIFESTNNNVAINEEEAPFMNQIDIRNAWRTTLGTKKTIIAVIDNGFDTQHESLRGKDVKSYNVISKTNQVNPSSQNHGTHVASIAVGNSNRYQGICPNCDYMPIKVEDENGIMSMSYVIDAILYAVKNKAAVINLSLGSEIPLELGNLSLQQQKEVINSDAGDLQEFWNDLFLYANERNSICVIAAGNSSVLTGLDAFQRSNQTIKVGTVSRKNTIASFSNFGNYNTIYAPGEEIYGAKPNNQYEYLDGTSMSAPIISGFIGLIKSKYPNYKFNDVMSLLMKNTEEVNSIKQLRIKSI
ncbi:MULTISPECIES: S8/S53 family peptidase [Weeksellaceae]|uniref:S8 family peptidase n=1 Tax=Weeksellaceae TaxID=2762318 RepID=UPI0025C06C21|nr:MULTISPECIES: S8/S53 family peptidase [unclassified Empedobacter]